MDDTWEIVSKCMTSLNDLHDRMDETRKLVYLEPFVLKNFKEQKADNVISVTGNRPAVEANAIISDLMGAKWQTIVEGDVTQKQSRVIEQFIEDNLDQADEFLLKRFGLVGLYDWLCNHICIRGPIGTRWLSLVENEEYHVDCVPCDMRWTAYEYGREGFNFVAPITWRTSDELLNEFPEAEGKLLKGKKDIEVRDYWDDEKNEVWIDKQLIKTQPHNLGRVPFVIAFPPSGFMLRDKDYIKHEAEDLFFLNRALYEEYNRSLSIEQTLGMDILTPPYEQEVEVLDADPAQPVPKSGQVTKVRKGERHVPVPRGDLNRASMTARQDIQRMIQQGGINDIDLGNVSQQVSAVWITEQSEIRNKLIRPRLLGLQIFKEQLSRLMIDQFLKTSQGTSELMVGRTGKKSSYSIAKLKDPDKYTISCHLMTKSKKQEVANWAIANVARGIAPLKVILRDILIVEDPDEWERELQLEEARRADPAIALFEMAIRYVEEAEELEDETLADIKRIESKMLTERGVAVIQQRKQPQPLPEEATVPKVEPTKGQTNALLPLMGRTGVEGGAPVTAPAEEG